MRLPIPGQVGRWLGVHPKWGCRCRNTALADRSQAVPNVHKYRCFPQTFQLFFFSSSALFAFWLRSSVVSVLFSLISERVLWNSTLIILIFGLRAVSSVLAHDSAHSVPGITLPPGDATFFRCSLQRVWGCEEERIVMFSPRSRNMTSRFTTPAREVAGSI